MKFYAEKDLAICGLACVLCSQVNCKGCKAKGCEDSDCTVYNCAIGKNLDGCYQCNEFPCEEKMLQGVRNIAFNQYAQKHGKKALLERLNVNFENGITYHKPDGLKGDYDMLFNEGDIIKFIRFGSHDVYEKCPVLETNNFILKLVSTNDAKDLLSCYSDEKSQAIFNSDNCTSDFCYNKVNELTDCIQMWLNLYEQKAFVRFSIIEKKFKKPIGTVEIFSEKAFYKELSGGVLRIDLESKYEKSAYISELLELADNCFYELFESNLIVMKCRPNEKERLNALIGGEYKPFDWQSTDRKNYFYKVKDVKKKLV